MLSSLSSSLSDLLTTVLSFLSTLALTDVLTFIWENCIQIFCCVMLLMIFNVYVAFPVYYALKLAFLVKEISTSPHTFPDSCSGRPSKKDYEEFGEATGWTDEKLKEKCKKLRARLKQKKRKKELKRLRCEKNKELFKKGKINEEEVFPDDFFDSDDDEQEEDELDEDIRTLAKGFGGLRGIMHLADQLTLEEVKKHEFYKWRASGEEGEKSK